MSHFDKLVASWVSSAESRPREEREKILSSISKNLETYRELENPSETYTRRQEEKQRQAEERRKQLEEEHLREEERRRQEAADRRASLPPLPPLPLSSKLSTHAKLDKPKSVAGVGKQPPHGSTYLRRGDKAEGTAPSSSQTSATLSESERARINASKLTVRDVDYKFEDCVSVALQKLRAGEEGPLLDPVGGQQRARRPGQRQPQPTPRATPRSTPRKTTPPFPTAKKSSFTSGASAAAPTEEESLCQSTRSTSSKREKASSGPSPVLLQAAGDLQASCKARTDSTCGPPAPVAARTGTTSDAAAGTREGGDSNGRCTIRGKPPALAMIQRDHEDAEEYRQDEVHEREQMEQFTFGARPTDSSHEDDDDDSDVPQLNATSGGGLVEGEPLDDDVDARRRADQQKRPSRFGISDASVDLEEARLANFPPTPKSRDKARIITKVLEKHNLFCFLDDSDIARFASIMDVERFKAGDYVLVKGEGNDTLFLILDGEAEATVEPTEKQPDGEVRLLGKGETCGDIGLMYDARNAVTVRAKTALECATLGRKTYKLVTSRSMAERREQYTQFITERPIFHDLPAGDVARVAEALKAATYQKGEKLIERGFASDWLQFVVEGTLEVIGRDGQRVATVEKGGCVGHLEFLFDHVAIADVVAASNVVKTAKLSRHQFDRLATAARAPMVKEVEEGSTYAYYREMMKGDDAPTTVPLRGVSGAQPTPNAALTAGTTATTDDA